MVILRLLLAVVVTASLTAVLVKRKGRRVVDCDKIGVEVTACFEKGFSNKFLNCDHGNGKLTSTEKKHCKKHARKVNRLCNYVCPEIARCTAGNYMTQSGCIQCPVNTFSKSGADKCTECSRGKVSPAGSTSRSACKKARCTAGNYMTQSGCVQCPVNTFSKSGADECTECNRGEVSPAGSTSRSACKWARCTAGNYMTQSGCIQCPVNTFSKSGADECTECNRGEVSPAGSTSRSACKWVEQELCPMETGYCITSDDVDQDTGVIQYNSEDGDLSEVQSACLERCLDTPGATGCEVIWGNSNRGCYIHTSEVARGSNTPNHACWVFSKCTDQKVFTKCPFERGHCVKADNTNQTIGVIKYNDIDADTPERQTDCLHRCLATPRATGCEAIWDRDTRGCYVYTSEVARGDKANSHVCWIFSKCKHTTCPIERGVCTQTDGTAQSTGVIKLNGLDGNTAERQAECVRKCLETPGATGCQEIWNQDERGCYAHTAPLSHGNDDENHSCWIFSQCKHATCPMEKGYCVKADNSAQTHGMRQYNALDGYTVDRQKGCLEQCLETPGATGCEVIWNSEDRGCYVHTSPISRGNHVTDHVCWVFSKCKHTTCPIERGSCVKADNSEQDLGVVNMWEGEDGDTAEGQEACLNACLDTPQATGCEVIWDESNRGCYAHTQEVARGDDDDEHMCWVFSKCTDQSEYMECPIEKGYCVKHNNVDQNSNVIKYNDLDGNTVARQDSCLQKCLETPRATGCEIIWDQNDRGCYVHMEEVARGNNDDKHMCWVFSKCSDKMNY